jgi:hypothetical protein
MGYEAISLLEALNGLTVAPRRPRPRRPHNTTVIPVEATSTTNAPPEETVINVNEDSIGPISSTLLEEIENDTLNEESTSESFVEAVNTL